MKTRTGIYVTSWGLLIITVVAGLGFTHFHESRFDPATHALIGALGQLVPLAGLFVLAGFLQSKNAGAAHPAETSSPVPAASLHAVEKTSHLL